MELMLVDPKITIAEMAEETGKVDRTIKRHIKTLKEQGKIERAGSTRKGKWKVQ